MPWEGDGPWDPFGRESCGLVPAPRAQLWVLVTPAPRTPSLEEGPGCPTGLVRRLFQGKPLFLVQFPQGPLQLLTILFSICKSFNVENCHPESDSVGCWSQSRLEPGCPIPAPQQGCLPPGHPTSPPGQPRQPETGCSSPTSPSCPRAGRSELLAVLMALPASKVLHFFLPPRVPGVAPPAPTPPHSQDFSSPLCSL